MAVTQKTPADPPFEVEDAKAARLVAAKVAVYADAPAQSAELPADADGDVGYTLDALMALTRQELDAIAAKLGIDLSKCKNKTKVAELILAAADSIDDDGEPDDDGDEDATGDPPPPFTGNDSGDVVV
jgi:hypothetical protein